MREPDDARRLEDLPNHEDDSDVDQTGSDPYDAAEPGMTGDEPDRTGLGFVEDITDDNHHA